MNSVNHYETWIWSCPRSANSNDTSDGLQWTVFHKYVYYLYSTGWDLTVWAGSLQPNSTRYLYVISSSLVLPTVSGPGCHRVVKRSKLASAFLNKIYHLSEEVTSYFVITVIQLLITCK